MFLIIQGKDEEDTECSRVKIQNYSSTELTNTKFRIRFFFFREMAHRRRHVSVKVNSFARTCFPLTDCGEKERKEFGQQLVSLWRRAISAWVT